MRTFKHTIISTLLGTFLLGTSNLMWAEGVSLLGIPQACQDVRATYKDDKQAINQSCLDVAAARDQALADCEVPHLKMVLITTLQRLLSLY